MKTTIIVNQKFELEDGKLRVETKRRIYEVIKKVRRHNVKKLLKEEKSVENFNLTEVDVNILNEYRRKKIPIFILKTDGKLFFSIIPRNLNLISTKFIGKHQCAFDRCTCKRLLSSSNDEGGCEKVKNFSKNIEKYPWITKGYETVNTEHEILVVVECQHKC